MSFMIDLLRPAREQIEWLSSGKINSTELLNAYIERWKMLNPSINAVVMTDIKKAINVAKNMDERRTRGEYLGPLQGLPITVKDTFDVDGMPAVAGDPKLMKRMSSVVDAATVKLIKDAGGIIWGKTNTPLYAGDIQTYNKAYGVTNNPYDVERTPGGSSGGSAAALAIGLTPLELGSDIGGSLRTPSHNCGTCGFKPSWGLISDKGHVPPHPNKSNAPPVDLGVVGPMARNIADLRLLMSVLAPDKNTPPDVQIDNLNLAIWKEPKFSLGAEVAVAVDKVASVCKRGGVQVSFDKPAIDHLTMLSTYNKLLTPIITADLPWVAKVLFRILRPLMKYKSQFGKLTLENMIVAATQTELDFSEAKATRAKMKLICEDFFSYYDVLIAPVTAVPAIEHNNKGNIFKRSIDVDGQRHPYTCFFEWIALANLCHLPSVVIPVSQSSNGLPIGLQLIGAEGEDQKLLAIAEQIEALLNFTISPNLENLQVTRT